jgi:release factor glutamine methyltransferase
LGLSREELIIRSDYKAGKAQCDRYFDLLKRRCNGECTAYILERKEFWALSFSVTPAVLVPRPDTEILVEAALKIIRTALPQSPMLDLCTGCGAVAIALKHECPRLEVWAADISGDALGLARKNAEALGCIISFFEGDLFKALKSRNDNPHFFLITANAPYIPSGDIASLPAEVRSEPVIALDGGKDGLDCIRRIIADAPLYLEPGGALVLEADPSQMETIAFAMKEKGFSEPELYKSLAGENRVIAGKLR